MGANSCRTAIGRPQWRHTQVGGVESGLTSAATSPAAPGVASTRTPSNCHTAARLSLRLPWVSRPSCRMRWNPLGRWDLAGDKHLAVTTRSTFRQEVIDRLRGVRWWTLLAPIGRNPD